MSWQLQYSSVHDSFLASSTDTLRVLQLPSLRRACIFALLVRRASLQLSEHLLRPRMCCPAQLVLELAMPYTLR